MTVHRSTEDPFFPHRYRCPGSFKRRKGKSSVECEIWQATQWVEWPRFEDECHVVRGKLKEERQCADLKGVEVGRQVADECLQNGLVAKWAVFQSRNPGLPVAWVAQYPRRARS
jgi:hypothetical protein